jgi:hypothetical protein
MGPLFQEGKSIAFFFSLQTPGAVEEEGRGVGEIKEEMYYRR